MQREEGRIELKKVWPKQNVGWLSFIQRHSLMEDAERRI
jgi:hypothetical protein